MRPVRSVLVGMATLAMLLLGLVTPAQAYTQPPLVTDAETCVSAGKVFVLVVDDTGKEIGHGCADAPTSGNDALTKAGLKFSLTPGSAMVCTIAGMPSQCPKTFAGQYWSYWTASQGKEYGYATTGSDTSKPAAGSIEGWCWTPKVAEAEQATQCQKFLTDAVNPKSLGQRPSSASPSASASQSASSTPSAPPVAESTGNLPGWLPAVIVLAAVAALGVGFAVVRSRRPRG